MEINQERKEIKKVSQFLSEMHVAHYIYDSSLYIPGKVTLASLEEPMEIRVEQDSGMAIRVLKDNDKVYVEAWKDINGVTYGDAMRKIEVVYYGGKLEIRFTDE